MSMNKSDGGGRTEGGLTIHNTVLSVMNPGRLSADMATIPLVDIAAGTGLGIIPLIPSIQTQGLLMG